MKKIRIGNDIAVEWSIIDHSGNPYNLVGRDLVVEMIAKDAESKTGSRIIKVNDFARSANKIYFTYYGKDQTLLGDYYVKLTENLGEAGMKTLDEKEAFSLVPHSWQTGGTASVALVTESAEIQSMFATIKGEKGDKGDTGDTGAQGPKGDKGDKGDQGNSGYSGAAGELEVVNNDTAGGATAAWSAERGKILREDVDDMGRYTDTLVNAYTISSSIDCSELDVRNYSATTENKWGTNNSYKHSIESVVPGTVVTVTAPAGTFTRFAFLTGDDSPSSGGDVPVCTGTSVVEISAGTTRSFLAPSDAVYFLVYRGSSSSSYPNTPAYVTVTNPSIDEEGVLFTSDASDAASVNLVADAVFGGEEYETEVIDFETFPVRSMYLNKSGTFSTNGEHGIVYVEPDDVIKVVGGGGLASFVSYIGCPYGGSASGAISVTRLESGKTYYFRAPSNAVGFMFNFSVSSTDYTPASIERLTPVGEKPSFRIIPTSRFIPDGGVLAWGANNTNKNVLIKVKKDRTYFVKFTYNNTSSLMFIEDLPRVGLSYTTVSDVVLNASAYQNKENTARLEPSSDGYYLFRTYKSSDPSITATVYDGTDMINTDDLSTVATGLDYQQLNINALTKRNYLINSNGLYGSSNTYKHVVLPIKPGQFVKVRKNTVNETDYWCRIAWFTANTSPVAEGVPPFVPGTGLISTEGGIYRAPEGTNYVYIYCGASPYNYFPSYAGISIDYDSMPGIVVDNEYIRTKRILTQITSQTRAEVSDEYKPLVLLHYSDIHGIVENQERINDYRNFWSDYITDTIHTGDLVADKFSDASPFGDSSDEDNPNKDILCVIGNHDTATKSSGTYNWHAKQGLDAYNKFFAPYISNWNVTQPEDAETYGYCYYYKDYTDSKIRMIVLDTFDDSADYQAAQQSWCESVLADAITNGLSVIMVSHFRIRCQELLKCPFTKPGAAVIDPDTSRVNVPYVELVKAFIDNGGELVCWLSGHSHYDAISVTSEEQGSQINICVSNASHYGSDQNLKTTNALIATDDTDWRTFDLFNIMAVDTVYKIISLLRVGSPYDKHGRRVETTCVKYDTKEIL